MQVNIHKANTRGLAQNSWLKSYHTYSFGNYQNPERTGFNNLLVINDDTIQPAQGFATHGHKNMEIISIPITDSLEHKDSEGHQSVIQYGDVQLMSPHHDRLEW